MSIASNLNTIYIARMDKNITSMDIRDPGLRALPPGVERYLVKGGGLSVISLDPDDKIEITDTEGKQKCEVIVFNKDGKPDCSLLGLKEKSDSKNIKKILSEKNESAFQATSALKKRNLDIGKAKASTLFNEDSKAGEKINLVSKDKCTCVFSAPGNPMKIDEQNPPTDLLLMIKRSKLNKFKDKPNIPEPLVDPLNEIFVERRTASEYRVKKGDYIQIINPFGRQCSDFLAFDTVKLEKGIEREIDPATTRTFMGALYPGPGLFSKFFDRDQEPMIEVVRDTVGRHDTFNLACTAKYYEDAGYFGHPNCSENLSNVMEKYGIKKRKGWPAINLFFNTIANAQNAVIGGDSWARPGDYVLFRAL